MDSKRSTTARLCWFHGSTRRRNSVGRNSRVTTVLARVSMSVESMSSASRFGWQMAFPRFRQQATACSSLFKLFPKNGTEQRCTSPWRTQRCSLVISSAGWTVPTGCCEVPSHSKQASAAALLDYMNSSGISPERSRHVRRTSSDQSAGTVVHRCWLPSARRVAPPAHDWP